MEKLYEISTNYIFPSDPTTGTLGSIDFNVAFIQWTGIPFIGVRNESKHHKVLLVIYGLVIMTIVTFIYTGLELYDLVLCYQDLNDLTQNTALSLTHLSGTIKVINVFYRRKDILRMIEQIKLMSKKYVISKKQQEAFYRGEFENKIPLLLYIGIVVAACSLAFIRLVLNPEQIAGKQFPFRVKMPPFLPLSIQLLYMCLGVSLAAFQVVGVDYLNVTLINQIRYQLKNLSIAFERLTVAGEINPIDANRYLGRLLKHHIMILDVRQETEIIFKYPLLLQFVISVIIFAMSGFQAIVQSHSDQAPLLYFYIGGIFFQLFYYCWFGNEVSEENKTLSLRGYNTPWYNYDQKFKKKLIIFLQNAQRPLNFTAGGFVDLSLTTSTGILGKSYSYIAFLKHMYGGK